MGLVLEQLRDAKRRLREARVKLVKWEEADYVSSILDALVESEGTVSAQSLAERHQTWSIAPRRQLDLVDDLSDQCRNAFRLFRSLATSILSAEFDRELRKAGIEVSGSMRELCRSVFFEVQRQRAQRLPSVLDRIGYTMAPSVESMEATQLKVSERDMALQHKAAAEQQRMRARAELESLFSQIAGLKRPRGLVYAWSILVYMAVVGVALPLGLLPAGNETMGLKWFVLGAFFGGLGLLLHYFALLFTREED